MCGHTQNSIKVRVTGTYEESSSWILKGLQNFSQCTKHKERKKNISNLAVKNSITVGRR